MHSCRVCRARFSLIARCIRLRKHGHIHRYHTFQGPSNNIAAVTAARPRFSFAILANTNVKGHAQLVRDSLDPTIMQLPSRTCNTGLRCHLLIPIALVIFCNIKGGSAVRSVPVAKADLRTIMRAVLLNQRNTSSVAPSIRAIEALMPGAGA